MKLLAAFILVLLILLSACFSYAHLKIYQHRFEQSLMSEGTRALRSNPELSQVSLSFQGLDARLSGFVSHPRFRLEAQEKIHALAGARALARWNQIRVSPVLRLDPQSAGGYRVTGWMPSDLWRDRVAALLATCAPRQVFDVTAIQVDPTVLDPAYLDQASLPSLLGSFFASVSQGALVLEPNRLALSGTVRTETEKLALHSLAQRSMPGPGNPVVENNIVLAAGADQRGRGQAWVGAGIPGLDLGRALRSFPIFFDSGSTVLKPEEAAKVDQVVAAIRQLAPQGRFVVTGFSDSSGAASVNQRLSLGRAEAVAALMAARGLPRGQLELRSVIEKLSAAQNKNPDARRRSRRVEVTAKDNASRIP